MTSASLNLRWFVEPICAELENTEPQKLLGQAVSDNSTWPFKLKNGEPTKLKLSHKTRLSHKDVRATLTQK
ncbi:hypothetical protein DMW21_09320 [Vibrio parahaemolyticus]|nr:hypothetical protein [Vibrio parahaemolyticus]EGR2883679.1 hypothetical protein [Vibrio parahaemolyticus]EGR2974846.1 hypothetical protein [Vibrio parahaemolyticus]EGR3011333.1 hypothetical protein [Vibrio parahaemolyticus]